jgi:predicted Ser/Thr protein kinase
VGASDDPAAGGNPGADLVGRTIAGRYRILSCLGEGAMGTVYLAEHLRIGRRDAIKVLRPDITRDTEAVARFARGARNVSAIRHPNVCTIYDFSDTEDGLQYLAMEYVAGETLKETLDREGRLELRRSLRIARQVALALQAAHDAGIVHRDLKPGNIMITPLSDGVDAVKVVDFDIAKGRDEPAGEEVTRLGFVIGTPEYMSPEQLMGERVDGRSDVYSLGVVLFRMLTGSLPCRGGSTQEIMVQRLTVPPLTLAEALPGVEFPALLQDVLSRAQDLDRAARYADVASFARDLEVILGPAAGDSADSTPRTTDAIPPTRVVPAASVATVGSAAGARAAAAPAPAAGAPTAAPWVHRHRFAMAAGVALLVVVAGAAAVVVPRLMPAGESPAAVHTETPTVQRDAAASPAAATIQAADDRPAPAPAPAQPSEPPGGSAAASRPVANAVAEPTVAALLARQNTMLATIPGGAVLQAVRDTGSMAWARAATRSDSADAAGVLARAALLAGDLPECRRWAARGLDLSGADFFRTLLEACR